MGGEGSGRHADPVKQLIGFNQPAPTDNGMLYLPNLSGVKEEAKKTSGDIIKTHDLTLSEGYTDFMTNKSRCNMFDGVDDYVEIPHNAAQLGANLSNGFTISAWVNIRGLGETAGFILDKSAGTGNQNGFVLRGGTAGNYQVVFSMNGGTSTATAINSFTWSGEWRYILMTITSTGVVNFYLNGILSGAANQATGKNITDITTTNAMRIGNRATATDRTFDGSIRSVKMWNKVLSTAEIAQDYAEITPAKESLIHFFKLGGDYNDYGTVGVAATNSGSVVANVFDTPILTNSAVTISGADVIIRGGVTTSKNVSGASMIVINDQSVSGASFVLNTVYTEGSTPTASNYPVGTLLVIYTP